MTLPMSRPAPRLPGVYVETVRPPRADDLPRMDVAAFVGFAASGPLDVPVPVEDVGRFREIFGADLVLARDEARARDQTSLLGPAIEAFFANGGQRAFVLRVADAATAVTLDMPVPGLADSLGNPAAARARSPGLWPARLAADTRLRRRRLIPAPGTGLTVRDGLIELRVAPGTEAPRRGDLLEASFGDAALLALIVVDGVSRGTIRARIADAFWHAPLDAASPPDALGIDDPGLVAVDGADPAIAALLAASPPAVPDRLAALTFDLVLWDGARIAHRLDGLGFAAAHPRYWAGLPDDDELHREVYGRRTRRLSPDEARFEREAATPRFPLAGPAGDAAARIWLPRDMQTATDRDRARAPLVPPGPGIEAEGLARFDDRLFLDPRFAQVGAAALAAEMEARHADSLGGGRALAGLHALAPVAEVAMVAVPDAVHRPWSRAIAAGPALLDAPFLDPLPRQLDAFGRLALRWTPVPGASRYRLELAETDEFALSRRLLIEDTTARVAMTPGCPVPVAAQVRAERGGEAGPWSNTRRSRVPEEDFDACGTTDPDRLTLRLAIDEAASPGPVLRWQFEPPGAPEPGDRYQFQQGAAPGLEDARDVALPPDATEHLPDAVLEGALYFRVRALRGTETGPWSATLRLDATARGGYVLEPEDEYDVAPADASAGPSGQAMLTAIHRALIRFAAARADAVALLSLPRHYREREIDGHLARLSPLIDDLDDAGGDAPAGALLVPGLRFGEETALSYAALQHPWFATVDATNTGFQPPDGAIAGLIARRASGPGAWIAAANLPIDGAVALDPKLDDATQARLIARQVNTLRRDPRGFLVFNAETLSPSADLRPLPVRLLMILLRRLALRDGAAYVFEPHSADFRALVRRRFERMLSLIHQRGGFAGDTPAQSYNVVTDDSVNPPGAIDRGQFTVELRVAPSRPFRYLNVRLMRTGAERLSVEESQ